MTIKFDVMWLSGWPNDNRNKNVHEYPYHDIFHVWVEFYPNLVLILGYSQLLHHRDHRHCYRCCRPLYSRDITLPCDLINVNCLCTIIQLHCIFRKVIKSRLSSFISLQAGPSIIELYRDKSALTMRIAYTTRFTMRFLGSTFCMRHKPYDPFRLYQWDLGVLSTAGCWNSIILFSQPICRLSFWKKEAECYKFVVVIIELERIPFHRKLPA